MILTATGAELRELLRSCLAVPRWIREVESGAPYPTGQALLGLAYRAATPLSRAEIDQALADHPRIGREPAGDGRAADFSRREQQAPDADDAGLAAAVEEGNAAYEARFGRVFLIRAAGRTRAEIRAEQLRRLASDEQTELETVGRELREIALLRLRILLDQNGAPDGSDGPGTGTGPSASASDTSNIPGDPAVPEPSATRSRITTHVLDTARGVPAAGLGVTLERHSPGEDPAWEPLGHADTDTDGRISALGPTDLTAGRYRLTFDTGAYLLAHHGAAFYPEVAVTIDVADTAAHYHVPLLLSPFHYSTYRGS